MGRKEAKWKRLLKLADCIDMIIGNTFFRKMVKNIYLTNPMNIQLC